MNETNTYKSNRIDTLDGFRFIAILGVVLFHYYTCWLSFKDIPDPYPYGDKCDFFSNGRLGVEFFFIISGFVIAYTLSETNTFAEFWKKRIIRLFPSMLICSFITLLFCIFFDTNNLCPESHSLANFFVSLTFIHPYIVAKIYPCHIDLDYLSHSYWSLWPEIQFYFVAGVIYYLKPDKFVRIFSILSILLYCLFLVAGNIHGTNVFHIQKGTTFIKNIETVINVFNITSYILWFCIGVIFFDIYSKGYKIYTAIILCFASALLLHFYSKGWEVRLIIFLMLGAFWIFIYYPFLLNWLNNKLITSIGLTSYTLYLIHQEIGIVLISKYAILWGKLDFLFPILMMILFVLFSLSSYRFVEKPVNKFLKQKFLSKTTSKLFSK